MPPSAGTTASRTAARCTPTTPPTAARRPGSRPADLGPLLTDDELVALEAEVQRALATGDRSALDLRGFGITSVVLAGPVGAPTTACKRVPPFRDRATFDRYRDVVLHNIDELRASGVTVLETEVRLIEHDGNLVGYVLQPLLPPEVLGEAVLKGAEPSPDHPLVQAMVDRVLAATTERRGIDAQVGNWAVLDGVVHYVDVTTPYAVDEAGGLEMELDVFLEAGPPVLRPLYRRQLPPSMTRWLDARHALLDLVGNLYKLDLDDWVEPIITATRGRVDPPITVTEAREYYGGEVASWSLLHKALLGYAWWQRRVRRQVPNSFVPPADYDPVAWKAKKRAWN